MIFKKNEIKEKEIKEKETVTDEPEIVNLFKTVSKQQVFNEVINYFNKETNLINQVNRGLRNKEEVYRDIRSFIKPFKLQENEIEEIIKEFNSFVWGYWRVDKLIHDKDISDIKVLAPFNTRIKVLGERLNSDVVFKSEEEIIAFADSIATKNETSLANINAIQSFTDNTTSDDFILRINISTGYVNSVPHPYIHIRKIPKKKRDLQALLDAGMLTNEELEEIKDDMESGMSLLLCGKGASGKTTLLNAMLDLISHRKSCLVIQESEELFTNNHPDMMFQRVRRGIGEGRISYSLKELAINGLLVDIDYFAIGEIKGDEAIDFINASYTGSVVLASIHSNSSKEAPNKLVHYMKYASDYKRTELLEMMKDIDKIYFLNNFEIKEITEIEGYSDEKNNLIFNTTFLNHKRIAPSCKKVIDKKKRYIP